MTPITSIAENWTATPRRFNRSVHLPQIHIQPGLDGKAHVLQRGLHAAGIVTALWSGLAGGGRRQRRFDEPTWERIGTVALAVRYRWRQNLAITPPFAVPFELFAEPMLSPPV